MRLPRGLCVPRLIPFGILAALLLSSQAVAAPTKVKLEIKAEAGTSSKYRNQSKLELKMGDESISINTDEEIELKFLRKDQSNFVFESNTLKSESTVNGEKMEDEGDESPEGGEFTYKPNGELVAYKDKDDEMDKETLALTMRLFQSGAVIFSSKEISVGETWTHDFKANKDWGTYDAKGTFKLVAIEEVSGAMAAKVEVTYEETGAERNIRASGTAWFDITSAETVKSQLKYENVPFDFGGDEKVVGSSTDASEKVSGGFVAVKATAGGEAKPVDTKKEEPKKDEPKKEEPKKEEDKTTIDFKTKGWEKLPGLFTIYRKVDDGRTRLSLEVTKSQLRKLFILQTTAATGDASRMVAGNPVSDLVFEFREMPNNKLYMVVPNYNWRAPKNPSLQKVLERSFSDSFVEAFDIDARQKDRDSYLIDISQLLTGNVSRLFEQVQGGGNPFAALMGGGGALAPDREKTFINTVKVFPTNIYAETVFAFAGSRPGFDPFDAYTGEVNAVPDSRSLSVKVIYNLFEVPAGDYTPRRADARVGYFNVAHRNWDVPQARDQKVENIVRWDLRKKNPSAEMSEPVKPITFWVDNGFPEKYRDIVRNALLSWNKAFERIGIKNAIEVKLMDDKSDFDHADLRYNVVRLVASPADAYAVAQFRTNPLTGQVINASITVDANFMRAIEGEWELTSPIDTFKNVRRKLDTDPKILAKEHEHSSACACNYGKEAAMRAATGITMLNLIGGKEAITRKEQFAKEFLFNVVQHEFGHILGLRHNFVASTQLTPAELSDKAKVERHNVSASVMDYVNPNTYAYQTKDVPFYSSTLGDYDYWAIQFGYMQSGIKDPDKEAEFLKAVANQGGKYGLEYQSDEQADGLDPYTTRFDLSSDPLAHYEKEMQMSRSLLMSLGDRLPAAGQSYFEFTRTFNVLLNNYSRAASQTTRFIGGAKRSFAFKGDAAGVKPFQPLPGAESRRSLELLKKYILSEKALELPKSYYKLFATDPKGTSNSAFLGAFDDYPMFDQLASLQSSALSALMSQLTLSRVQNFEWKAVPGEDVLKVSEIFGAVRDAVWAETEKGGPVTPLRRQLQRDHVDRLIQLGVKRDLGRGDINLLAWGELKGLLAELSKAKSTDATTSLHYEETVTRIKRALAAIETIGGGGGGGGGFDLSSLFGGRTGGK